MGNFALCLLNVTTQALVRAQPMEFAHDWTSRYPAHRLFEVHRDHLAEFGSQLPGVRGVRRVDAQPRGNAVALRHHWQGDPAVLPTLLRPMGRWFVWQDHSDWDATKLSGTWRIIVPGLASMIQIHGTHVFRSTESGAEVHVSGEANIAFVGRWGGETANRFVQRLFSDILQQATAVIEAHCAARDRP